MGISSNEYCADASCATDGSNAVSKTVESWDQARIGYHYSTDRYVNLPPWFDNYTSDVKTAQQQRQQENKG